jgi:hypothetical protein
MVNVFNFDVMYNEGQHFVDINVVDVCDILSKTRAMPIIFNSLTNLAQKLMNGLVVPTITFHV